MSSLWPGFFARLAQFLKFWIFSRYCIVVDFSFETMWSEIIFSVIFFLSYSVLWPWHLGYLLNIPFAPGEGMYTPHLLCMVVYRYRLGPLFRCVVQSSTSSLFFLSFYQFEKRLLKFSTMVIDLFISCFSLIIPFTDSEKLICIFTYLPSLLLLTNLPFSSLSRVLGSSPH